MKHRISITLDEVTVLKMKEAVRLSSVFRNQSHYVEIALKEKLEGSEDE
ncbi:MAG: hypothetical protein V3V78_01025 [Candidatus Woesearchaeota archaeon]